MISEYLEKLVDLKNQCAENLAAMGIEAADTETLETLVPKILHIQVGDLRHEYCDVTLLGLSPSYGFYSFTEEVKLAGALDVVGFYKIRSAEVVLTGEGLSALSVTARGWSVTQSDAEISITRSVLGMNGAMFEQALQEIRITCTGTENLVAQVSLKLIGDETGTEIGASGTAELRYQASSWAAFDAAQMTWTDVETAEMTWSDIENFPKPST